MKKIVTVLALLSLVMTSRAGITGSYDYATKTLTVNYVYVADPYDANNDGINPSDLNYLNLNASMVDRIVLTGEWKNKNMQKAGELVIKYASRQDPVELDLSACKGLVSKFKSVTDYINVQDFDNTTTTFSYEPMWGETFNLDKAREEDRLSGIVFPANSPNFTYVPGELVNYSANLKKVVISEGIKAIGNKAFMGSKIENLTLGSTVTEIGKCAFMESNITTLDLSKLKLSKIRQQTFRDCKKLASVEFPTTITQIQAEAFQRSAIVKADLSQCHQLNLLAYQCFSECVKLDSVIICTHEKVIRGSKILVSPDDYSEAGGGAFYNARNIKVVELKYCNGTDVTKCKCENAAFDYDVTHVQTKLSRVPEACKLIYPKGNNASAPYNSNFDYFVGEYKANAVLRQSHLLYFWRYVPCKGNNVNVVSAQKPSWFNLDVAKYEGNGWLEFLSTDDFDVINPKNGQFIRTYSRTEGSGPTILPYGDEGVHAFRILDFRSTASLTDESGEPVYDDEGNEITIRGYILLKELVTEVELEIPDLDETGKQKVDGQGFPLTKTVTVKRSYVPENTGVVLHSKKINESVAMVMAPYEGNTQLTEYPNTGSKAYTSNYTDITNVETNVNMLMGSFGQKKKIAPTDPWNWGDYGPSGQGCYGDVRTFRNFGLVTNSDGTGTWKRAQPGQIRENRAYAHLPVGRFNNENEDSSVTDLNGEENFASEDDGSSQSICIGMIFEGDDATGVFTIEGNGKMADDDAWYTPQGVRVAVPGKGIYIHNNKKVIFK